MKVLGVPDVVAVVADDDDIASTIGNQWEMQRLHSLDSVFQWSASCVSNKNYHHSAT